MSIPFSRIRYDNNNTTGPTCVVLFLTNTTPAFQT